MLVDVRPLTDLGFFIFPIVQGAKHPPLVKNWPAQASNERVQVGRWFSRRCNVGVATGPLSNVFVLDIDPKSGGGISLAGLIHDHGMLPATLTAGTPSAGQHRYFRWPQGGDIFNSAGMVGEGLDIRGQNGYVLAPPSYIVDRETGEVRDYVWEMRAPIAEAPDWLVTLARERTHRAPGETPMAPQAKRPLSENERDLHYGEAALLDACRQIASAPNGRQEMTLVDSARRIGKLVGSGYLGAERGLSELVAAGMQMPNYDGRDAWTHQQVSRKVLSALTWGMAHPWQKRDRRRLDSRA
jgi:bifunctional DNA primase/polymerase-like protein